MHKRDERRDQRSCFNRAWPNEMVFVLLARDKAAPWAVRFWCILRVLMRKNHWRDPQIQDAWLAASEMAWFRREHIREY